MSAAAAPAPAEERPPPAPSHDNCFDLLRLLFAGCVVYGHSWLLGGFGPEPIAALAPDGVDFGFVGVLGFFCLSGHLVTVSYRRLDSPWRFLLQRARRILPGYWTCLAMTAFVAGPLLAALEPAGPAFTAAGGLHYLLANAALPIEEWHVAGHPAATPYTASINGSLWTIWLEVRCYLGVLLLGATGLVGRRWVVLAMAAGMTVAHVVKTTGLGIEHLHGAFRYLYGTEFVVGFGVAMACTLEPRLVPRRGAVILALALVLAACWPLGVFRLLGPLLAPSLVLALARRTVVRLRDDLSYGTYLYAFALQQVLAALVWPRQHWLLYFLLSVAGALLLAFASWRLVERPFLAAGRSNRGA